MRLEPLVCFLFLFLFLFTVLTQRSLLFRIHTVATVKAGYLSVAVLWKVALDVLPAQASAVPCERIFSSTWMQLFQIQLEMSQMAFDGSSEPRVKLIRAGIFSARLGASSTLSSGARLQYWMPTTPSAFSIVGGLHYWIILLLFIYIHVCGTAPQTNVYKRGFPANQCSLT